MWALKLVGAIAKLHQKVGVRDGCGRPARIKGKSLKRGKNSDLHVWKQLLILRGPLNLDIESIYHIKLEPRSAANLDSSL